MSWESLKFGVKDFITAAFYLVTATIFVISIRDKVVDLTDAVNEIKTERKESFNEDKVYRQNIQNQVNANSLQIQLMKQDIEMIKQGFYGK